MLQKVEFHNPAQLFVIPHRAPSLVRACPVLPKPRAKPRGKPKEPAVDVARVERTLLSAAFDFALDPELRDSQPPPVAPWKSGASAPRKAFGWRSASSAAKRVLLDGPGLQPQNVCGGSRRFGNASAAKDTVGAISPKPTSESPTNRDLVRARRLGAVRAA